MPPHLQPNVDLHVSVDNPPKAGKSLKGALAGAQGQHSTCSTGRIPGTHTGPALRPLHGQDPWHARRASTVPAPWAGSLARTQGQHCARSTGRIPGTRAGSAQRLLHGHDPWHTRRVSTAPAPWAGSLARAQGQHSACSTGSRSTHRGLWSAPPARFFSAVGQHQPYTWCCSASTRQSLKSRPEEIVTTSWTELSDVHESTEVQQS